MYIYIYIYVCVCVCVCVFFSLGRQSVYKDNFEFIISYDKFNKWTLTLSAGIVGSLRKLEFL